MTRPRPIRRSSRRVGGLIAGARRAAGLSQAALAAQVGVGRTAMSRIESGSRGLASVELARIARALGRPMDSFLSHELAPGQGPSGGRAEGGDPVRAARQNRDAILRIARQHGARSVRVFGSVARGEARPDSDIDLLVEMEPGRGLLEQASMLLDLQRLLGHKVDVATPEGLREQIRDRVLSEAKPL